MAKKIIILTSSPRKNGNTNTLAKWAAQGAAEAGAEVETVDVAHLEYKTNGCTACMGCQQSEQFKCVIKDEVSPLIARIPEFDVMVWATPVYYMGFNAQLKLFIDRTLSLFKFNEETGEIKRARSKPQTLALISTAGGGLEDSGIKLADQTARTTAAFFNDPYQSLLMPNAPMEPGKLDEASEWSQKAKDFGKKLAQG